MRKKNDFNEKSWGFKDAPWADEGKKLYFQTKLNTQLKL